MIAKLFGTQTAWIFGDGKIQNYKKYHTLAESHLFYEFHWYNRSLINAINISYVQYYYGKYFYEARCRSLTFRKN